MSAPPDEIVRDGRMRLSTLFKIVAAVCAGVILGLLVTIRSLDLDTRGLVAGVWRTAPRDGTGAIDPYALAANARSGLLPLGASEGLSFVARSDARGDNFDPDCVYEVAGPMPPARFWTLSLLDRAGFPLPDDAARYGFTSTEVLRLDGYPLRIVVSSKARPGNWLPIGGDRGFVLMLRLYDTSLTSGGTDFSTLRMPSVERTSCG